MSRLRVVPIVEGHGEVESVRILLQRIWGMLGGEFIDVVRPFRAKRGRLVMKTGLQEAIRVALLKQKPFSIPIDFTLVLILIDADEDCPRDLAPRLLEYAREENPTIDMACVLANVEYETWFVAAAESLCDYLDLTSDEPPSDSFDETKHGKAWIEQRFRDPERTYSPTQDQPAMTKAMDLTLCQKRAPSFDKLCRELEQRLRST
jgi:hypothetical protein